MSARAHLLSVLVVLVLLTQGCTSQASGTEQTNTSSSADNGTSTSNGTDAVNATTAFTTASSSLTTAAPITTPPATAAPITTPPATAAPPTTPPATAAPPTTPPATAAPITTVPTTIMPTTTPTTTTTTTAPTTTTTTTVKPLGPCSSVPCKHGVCSANETSYWCTCDEGWTGRNCSEDIDECANKIQPVSCREHSTCVNTAGSYTCPCVDGYLDVDGVCRADTLWKDYKNYTRQCNTTVCSISTAIPFSYYGRIFNQISIYKNGYASLDNGLLLEQPPLKANWPLSPIYLGVYWANLSIQNQTWLYVYEEKPNASSLDTSSSLSTFVKKVLSSTYSSFQPLYVIAATWDGAQPYPATKYPNDKATFQLILATDGVNSFAIKNYAALWNNINIVGRPLVYQTYTWKNAILTQDKVPVSWSRADVLAFDQQQHISSVVNCVKDLQASISQYNNQSSENKCPCNLNQSKMDLRFTTGSNNCYTSQVPTINAHCCYDTSGQLFKSAELNNKLSQCCKDAPAACKWLTSEAQLPECTYKLQTAWGYGYSHLKTFDGNKYTLNDIGDFIVLKLGDVELQGRTEKHGSVNTTYFTSFAIKVKNASFVYTNVNAELLAKWAGNQLPDGLQYHVQPVSNTIVNFSTVNWVLQVSLNGNVMSYTVYVYNGNLTTSGLLGTLDNNASNDFQFQNGTTISGTASKQSTKTINEFVESCKKELFFFSKGKINVSSFEKRTTVVNYEPEEFPTSAEDMLKMFNDSNEEAMASQLCKEEIFCLQDYFAFNSNSTALETQNKVAALDSIKEESEIKTIVFANNMTEYRINGSKALTVELKFQGNVSVTLTKDGFESSKGLVLENTTITWNISLELESLRNYKFPKTLAITARDANNNTGQYKPRILLCLCEKENQCNYELSPYTDVAGDFNGNVHSVACVCDERSKGQYCEIAANVCENCFNTSACNQTAADYCSACPTGYEGDGKTCTDINECANNNGGCEQSCTNLAGSSLCGCKAGFLQNGNTCTDVNECENLTVCGMSNKYCSNSPGSYSCLCFPGLVGDNCIRAPYIYLGTLVIVGQEWTNELTIKSSLTFATLADKIKTAVKQALTSRLQLNNDTFYVDVLSFETKGSGAQSGGRRKRETTATDIVATYEIRTANYLPPDNVNTALSKAYYGDGTCKQNCLFAPSLIVSGPPSINATADLCQQPMNKKCDPLTTTCQTGNQTMSCTCKTGFSADDLDPYSCKDIDECTGVNNCNVTEFCSNNFGSYECICSAGLQWDKTITKCTPDKCSSSPCQHDGVCYTSSLETSGYLCRCTYEWDGPTCSDENTDARKMKIAVICISVILGFLCLCLIIILIVVCVRNRRKGSDWTLDSHTYTNSRYKDFESVPRPKVKGVSQTYGTEMAENGHGNHYESLDSDDKRTSFGRHAPAPGNKEGAKHFTNKAYENNEVVQERL
ncbi:mucin-like protein [Physella acuta]|uniref:mucin-like protein n=1 Tax=Physella acuta TaxID=109671 RepID=UPI0027DE2876|nr:mucin-like protein [Physella acuta]